MRYLLILVSLLIASPVWAEDETHDQCMQQAETNEDFRQCNGSRLEILDAELNRVWRELYRPIATSGAKAALLNEQRKWIEFKDNTCIFWHYGFGTAGRDMFFYDCRAKIIEQRIEALRHIAALPADNLVRPRPFQRCNSGATVDMTKIFREALASGTDDICAIQFGRFENADTELNQIWREIRSQWKNDHPERWQALLDEQRKWVAFKENACEYRWHHAEIWECTVDLTNQRIKELKEILNF